MKTHLALFASLAAAACFGSAVFAQNPSPSPSPATPPAAQPAAPAAKRDFPHWDVRVEALMVNMPEDKSLTFLPELLSAEKLDPVVAKLLAAVERKEATLTGYPVVEAHDGQRGSSESVMEKLYPTNFELPSVARAPARTAPPEDPGYVCPASFEKRNVGVTLEVEPEVLPDGERISLDMQLQRVIILGTDSYDAYRSPGGAVAKIEQPRFTALKNTTSLTMHSGQWTLLGIHKMVEGPALVEFFLVRAVATPAR